MTPMKTCRRCRRELPRRVTHFYRCAGNADGLRTACIPCLREEAKERYTATSDTVLARKRQRYAERAAAFATSPQWQHATTELPSPESAGGGLTRGNRT